MPAENQTKDAAAHTPGPWTAVGHFVTHGDDNILLELDGDGTTPHEDAANALLIAASPNLLAALTDILAGWRYIRTQHGDLPGVGWDRAEDAARAAIARATGEA